MRLVDFVADGIRYQNARVEQGEGIYDVIRLAFGSSLDEDCEGCMDTEDVRQQLQRFPEGQFVALDGVLVVAYAATMRTSYPPEQHPKTWMAMLGDLGLRNHEPRGDWLYGAEMAVRPDYHGYGIGTQLYEIRFDLVRRLNLRGWYAAGMLMGYPRYRHQMSVAEYGWKVIRRELDDPTVTMQMNRGFEARTVIEEYMEEPLAGNAAVLIVWKNPDYHER